MLDLEIADYDRSIKALNLQLITKDKEINDLKSELKINNETIGKLKIDIDNYEKEKEKSNDYDEEKKEEYEIQIQLDVVKGVLNDETVGKISCMFRDKNLMNMYNALTNEKHNKYEINKKRFFIDIEDLKKQQRIKEESLKKEKDSVQKDSYESVPSEPLKKGGKTRRYMKKSNRRTRSR
jgi:predicted  nucleic acid-binding Zn-ribbon protein